MSVGSGLFKIRWPILSGNGWNRVGKKYFDVFDIYSKSLSNVKWKWKLIKKNVISCNTVWHVTEAAEGQARKLDLPLEIAGKSQVNSSKIEKKKTQLWCCWSKECSLARERWLIAMWFKHSHSASLLFADLVTACFHWLLCVTGGQRGMLCQRMQSKGGKLFWAAKKKHNSQMKEKLDHKRGD